MPIIKQNNHDSSVKTLFAGRVLRVERCIESRNHSDTLDYSDWRTTECTYALVWLGTHGVVPTDLSTARPRVFAEPCSWDKVRDLEFYEQFAWVDCTNMYDYRNGYTLTPTVDADVEPLAMANLVAWEAYHKTVLEAIRRSAEAKEAARKEAARVEAAAAAARDAKRQAKVDASRPAAEALLAKVPPKGTTVTVDGVTGKVAWMGSKVFRGRWSARVGVKDSRGEMHWVDAAKF